ncbi:phosphoglycerate mutase [Tindallia magadiensis]|uniref:2,3-bisphosphoglycerate-independent phosphoglycerate mutase n=2 Tax=Tindallia magadiensis TaxID=69895 RepID=A0A1I3AS66_9FIRM|nr:phosphoglycerate mutase [Tindallia magadiensis]
MMKKPVVLMILDGLGKSDNETGNAVFKADMPIFKEMFNKYPNVLLEASGLAVGLPQDQMGNSEVGHLNIGAGRIVYQELTRISKAIKEGDFFSNPQISEAMLKACNQNTTLHLMGLLSDGGVHSHIEHLFALLEMAKQKNVNKVAIHCFLDGRDTPPQSAVSYIEELEKKIHVLGLGRIATVSGRYYAMDRDKRWDRTELAYSAMTKGVGIKAKTAVDAVKSAYKRGENDEFIKPTIINEDNQQQGQISTGDSVIFFNFRPDRARQMTRAFMDEDFPHFERDQNPIGLCYVTMTQYDQTIKGVKIAFLPQQLRNTLGEVLSQNGKKQLRIAETEKYAHVTYFFNGGIEKPYEGEDRILIQSPKVSTYDLKPEMSASEVTQELLQYLDSNDADFIVVNYANPDMVGHTGIMEAVVKSLETVDECVGMIVKKVLDREGVILITSDHGNAEELIDEETGSVVTAHTTNPVPLILAGLGNVKLHHQGKLCDLAPTVLDIMNMHKPSEMSGHSLLIR